MLAGRTVKVSQYERRWKNNRAGSWHVAQRLAAATVEWYRGRPVAAANINVKCSSTWLLFIPALAKHKKLKLLRHRSLLPLLPDATQKEARHIADWAQRAPNQSKLVIAVHFLEFLYLRNVGVFKSGIFKKGVIIGHGGGDRRWWTRSTNGAVKEDTGKRILRFSVTEDILCFVRN